MVTFRGVHFVKGIILPCVCWYVAYPLSYRHVEELMRERGVEVAHHQPMGGNEPTADRCTSLAQSTGNSSDRRSCCPPPTQ
jgi:hypothetical protein